MKGTKVASLRIMAREDSPAKVTVKIGGTEVLHDKRLQSLVELVDEIRAGGNDAEITYRPPTGRGVYWYEIVGLFIGLRAAEASISTIVSSLETSAINWVKARFSTQRSEDEPRERPKWITIYGPNGEKLKEIKARSVDEIDVSDSFPDE